MLAGSANAVRFRFGLMGLQAVVLTVRGMYSIVVYSAGHEAAPAMYRMNPAKSCGVSDQCHRDPCNIFSFLI